MLVSRLVAGNGVVGVGGGGGMSPRNSRCCRSGSTMLVGVETGLSIVPPEDEDMTAETLAEQYARCTSR